MAFIRVGATFLLASRLEDNHSLSSKEVDLKLRNQGPSVKGSLALRSPAFKFSDGHEASLIAPATRYPAPPKMLLLFQ